VGEPGWQLMPGVSAPVDVAAAEARRPAAGFAVGDAGFASPTTGWAYVGDGRAAQCRVLFTEDAGATWSKQLAWRGLFYGTLAAFDERQAGFALAVSQGDDINGYRREPRAAGDPFIGPDVFLAGTQDAGATWTLAPNPDRRTSGAHFLTPRQIWLRSHVSGEDGGRTDLIRTQDGGATWHRLEGRDGVAAVSVNFQSATQGLLVTAKGDRADLLYGTALCCRRSGRAMAAPQGAAASRTAHHPARPGRGRGPLADHGRVRASRDYSRRAAVPQCRRRRALEPCGG
jgi:hypothetical protein